MQMFRSGTQITAEEAVQHLFQCCEDSLGDELLQSHKDAVTVTEDNLMKIVKKLPVAPMAVSVRRSELLSIKQDHGENTRSFFARINGKATTCAYSIKCCSDTCNRDVNFTEVIVKDVLVSGLVDDDIKNEMLGWTELDTKNVQETVSFIEAKEMARDSLTKQTIAGAISSYKEKNRCDGKAKQKATCKDCKTEMEKYAWSRRQEKMIECSLCPKCWKKSRSRKDNKRKEGPKESPNQHSSREADETSALLIGAVETTTVEAAPLVTPADNVNNKPIILDHRIFDSQNGWEETESTQHPTFRLRLTAEKTNYDHIGAKFPRIAPSYVTVVTDTGAQSCLCGLKDFYRYGFIKSDLTSSEAFNGCCEQ